MQKFEITENNCILKNVVIMQYAPKIKKCIIDNRGKTSLLFISDGVYRYTFNDTLFKAEKGCTIYLPKGSCYTYEVISEKAYCIQAEFDLISESYGKNEFLNYSETPLLLRNSEAEMMFRELSGRYFNDKLMTLSVLYRILSVFFGSEAKAQSNRKIQPAIDYIMRNLCEPVYISTLADICGLSASHLRRLFSESFGVSPIKYKNTLLAKYACELLENNSMNVSEIADALGFSDIYTFSSFFKKEIGVSPTSFIKNL